MFRQNMSESMLLKGQSRLFLQPFMTSRCCSAALQAAIISERGKSGDEASHGEPQGSSSQAAGVLQGGRMVLEQEGPPELLDKEKYCGIGHDKSAPGGMAEIGLTNSSVTNSPITPIPCLQLLAHNCLAQRGNMSKDQIFSMLFGVRCLRLYTRS